jgi:hypothetical protein
MVAQGHTDLTIFHAIISICEGGTLYRTDSHKAALKIIAICKAQAARSLRVHDQGLAALKDNDHG